MTNSSNVEHLLLAGTDSFAHDHESPAAQGQIEEDRPSSVAFYFKLAMPRYNETVITERLQLLSDFDAQRTDFGEFDDAHIKTDATTLYRAAAALDSTTETDFARSPVNTREKIDRYVAVFRKLYNVEPEDVAIILMGQENREILNRMASEVLRSRCLSEREKLMQHIIEWTEEDFY